MSDKRDADLLNIGQQCSHPICGLVDFLPFNCEHCKKSFCQEHFKVDAHSCKEYDETNFNRVAPDCPLCRKPIAFRPGEDPNIRMDRHLETECHVMTGKSQKTSSTPRCTHCRKVLFSPIQCNDCKHQFCPSHRFPGDHTCTPPSGKAQRAAGPSHTSNLMARFDSTAKKLMHTASTPTPMKSVRSTPAANPTSSSSIIPAASSSSDTPAAPSSSKPRMTLPFSKADRLSSVSVSSIFTDTSATSIPATTTNNNSIIVATPSVPNPTDTSSNKPLSLFAISSFIPRPIFVSA